MKFFKLVAGLSILFNSLSAHNIGLMIVATGKYIEFVPQLLDSARQNFMPEDSVTFFIFTDQDLKGREDDTVLLSAYKMGWPLDTMMRIRFYAQAKKSFESMDYLFACDADMLFVDEVGSEILSDRVATLHPGFAGKMLQDIPSVIDYTTPDRYLKDDTGWYEVKASYETNKKSTACVKRGKGEHYFAGGFWGGSKEEVMKMCRSITENIEKDLKNNYIAVWHDESHINRYFIDNKPTKILNSCYCYQEEMKKSYKPKLVALLKKHSDYR